MPLAITQIAAKDWPSNLSQGFNPFASSINPVAATIAAPIKTPNKLTLSLTLYVKNTNNAEIKNAIINAIHQDTMYFDKIN